MAELAVGGPQATDIFSLGASFHPQSSGNDGNSTLAEAQGSTGDNIANQLHDGKHDITASYKYVDTTALVVITPTPSCLLPKPGQLKGGYIITSVGVAYSNTDWPTITVTGHNHDSNAHDTDLAVYSPTVALAGGFGCHNVLTNTDTSGASSATSEGYTISCDHVDVTKDDGNHLAGATMNGKEELSLEYVGTPTLTTTGWYVTSTNASDANADFDTTSVSASKGVTRT